MNHDEFVVAMAEYYDKTLSPGQIAMYVEDLKNIKIDLLLAGFKKYRDDAKNDFFPRPAKIKEMIESLDGRPGVEEAWSLAPKSDHESAYINNEIATAWAGANDLLTSGDSLISARMAFKEIYERVVRDNRSRGVKPKWWLSRATGSNRDTEDEKAIRDAINLNRLSSPEALALLPHINSSREKSKPILIDGPSDGEETFNSIGQVVQKLIECDHEG